MYWLENLANVSLKDRIRLFRVSETTSLFPFSGQPLLPSQHFHATWSLSHLKSKRGRIWIHHVSSSHWSQIEALPLLKLAPCLSMAFRIKSKGDPKLYEVWSLSHPCIFSPLLRPSSIPSLCGTHGISIQAMPILNLPLWSLCFQHLHCLAQLRPDLHRGGLHHSPWLRCPSMFD